MDKNTSTFHTKEAEKARLCYPILNKNIRILKIFLCEKTENMIRICECEEYRGDK